MPEQTFELNGETVTVDVEDDARMLEVIRELVGLTGSGSGSEAGCAPSACLTCPSKLGGGSAGACSTLVRDAGPGH